MSEEGQTDNLLVHVEPISSSTAFFVRNERNHIELERGLLAYHSTMGGYALTKYFPLAGVRCTTRRRGGGRLHLPTAVRSLWYIALAAFVMSSSLLLFYPPNSRNLASVLNWTAGSTALILVSCFSAWILYFIWPKRTVLLKYAYDPSQKIIGEFWLNKKDRNLAALVEILHQVPERTQYEIVQPIAFEHKWGELFPARYATRMAFIVFCFCYGGMSALAAISQVASLQSDSIQYLSLVFLLSPVSWIVTYFQGALKLRELGKESKQAILCFIDRDYDNVERILIDVVNDSSGTTKDRFLLLQAQLQQRKFAEAMNTVQSLPEYSDGLVKATREIVGWYESPQTP